MDRTLTNAKEASCLTASELQSWNDHGYIVLKEVISASEVSDLTDAIWKFLEMRPNSSEDWYSTALRKKSGIDPRGMVPLYDHPLQWKTRQNDRIYKAFCELYGTRELYVSVDRVNMNPPISDRWRYDGFIHWDIDINRMPRALALQGLLSLSDTSGVSGGFQCVPGFHKRVHEWLALRPPGSVGRFPDAAEMNVQSIPMRAGDFLIWNADLPHGNSSNMSESARLAQYITMYPTWLTTASDQKLIIQRLQERLPHRSIYGTELAVSPKPTAHSSEVRLDDLGNRLLGMIPWDDPRSQ